MTPYRADQLLALSGIQHFVFCRRQWALIHVEQQWQENALTAEGRILHKRADDPFFTEKRGERIIARAVPVASYRLGLSGVCDVVEFNADPDGVGLPGMSQSGILMFSINPFQFVFSHSTTTFTPSRAVAHPSTALAT